MLVGGLGVAVAKSHSRMWLSNGVPALVPELSLALAFAFAFALAIS